MSRMLFLGDGDMLLRLVMVVGPHDVRCVPQSEPSSWAIKVYTHLCMQLQVFVALCTRTRIEVRQ